VPSTAVSVSNLRRSADHTRAILCRLINPYVERGPGDVPLTVFSTATSAATGPSVQLPGAVQDAALDTHGFHAAAIVREPAGGALHSWDVASGTRRFEPRDLGRAPSSLDFSPDGTLLATMDTAGPLRIFDAASGTLRHTVTTNFSQDVNSVVRFATDRRIVVYNSSRINVVELGAGTPVARTMNLYDGLAWRAGLGVSPDGRFAASAIAGSRDHYVRVCNLETAEWASPLLLHPDVVFVLVFTPDGRRLITAGRDGQLRVWDWAAGKLASPPCTADDEILDLTLSLDARLAFASVRKGAQPHGKLEGWDIATGKRVMPPVTLPASPDGLALAPDGRRGIMNVENNGIYAVDLSDLVDPDPIPSGEWLRLGELASDQRILDGDLVGLTTEEWLARWRVAHPRYPESPTPPLPSPASLGTVVHDPAIRPRSDTIEQDLLTFLAHISALARKERELFQTNTTDSSRGYIAATFALLNHDHAAYRDICRIMLLEHPTSDRVEAIERTAEICLFGGHDVPEALKRAREVASRILAGECSPQFVPWGCATVALAELRSGRFKECLHWLDRTEQSWGPSTYTEGMRAMAEHELGHTAAARRLLDAAESQVGGDVDNYIRRLASSANTGASTDAVFFASLLREAKTRILLDAAFPAQPFVPDAPKPGLSPP